MERFKTFEEYDQWRLTLARYPTDGPLLGLPYCGLKIAGEAGEVADKVGKLIRDHHSQLSEPKRLELLKELGDVLWYVSAIAYELDSSLEAVADLNFAKLEDRKARGVLGGDGDNR